MLVSLFVVSIENVDFSCRKIIITVLKNGFIIDLKHPDYFFFTVYKNYFPITTSKYHLMLKKQRLFFA